MAARQILERWSYYVHPNPETFNHETRKAMRPGGVAVPMGKQGNWTMTMSSGAGGSMYGFLACTAG